MKKNELFYRTKVPVNTPINFQLFILSSTNKFELESSINQFVRSEHIRRKDFPLVEVGTLAEIDKDRFFQVLSMCNLSSTEMALADRLDSVVKLSLPVMDNKIFESFFELRKAAMDISQILEDTNMVIDLDQGVTVSPILENIANLKGVPLARDYVTIKAYEGINQKTYVLESEGLVRFGLPEIALHEIPDNLGSDGAYLIRTVAQFLLSKLESWDNDMGFITVNEDVTIPCDYCEINNPHFLGVNEKLSAITLRMDEDSHNSLMYLEPCSDYDDYYDWLMEILDSVTQSRTKAHWIEEKEALVV